MWGSSLSAKKLNKKSIMIVSFTPPQVLLTLAHLFSSRLAIPRAACHMKAAFCEKEMCTAEGECVVDDGS